MSEIDKSTSSVILSSETPLNNENTTINEQPADIDLIELSDAEESMVDGGREATNGPSNANVESRRQIVYNALIQDGSSALPGTSQPEHGTLSPTRPQRDRAGLFTNAQGLNRLSDTNNDVEIVREIVYERNVNKPDDFQQDPSLVTADNREIIDLDVEESRSANTVDTEDIEVLQQTNTINTNELPEDVMSNPNYIRIQLPGNNSMFVYDRNGAMQRDRASFESAVLRDYNTERSEGTRVQRRLRMLNRQAESQREQLMHVSRRATDSILLNEDDLFHVDEDNQLESVNTEPVVDVDLEAEHVSQPPMSVQRLRQQQNSRRRMQSMQQRQLEQRLMRESGTTDLEVNNELTEVREKIGRYPDALKKAFDTCETLHTFQDFVHKFLPAGATDSIKNLKNLFIRYRSIRGNSRLESYTSEQREMTISHLRSIYGQNQNQNQRGQLRDSISRPYLASLVDDQEMLYELMHQVHARPRTGYDDDDDGEYNGDDEDDSYGDDAERYGYRRGAVGLNRTANQMWNPLFGTGMRGSRPDGREPDEDETTRNIIRMIETREARERETMTKNLTQKSQTFKNTILGRAARLPSTYTSSFRRESTATGSGTGSGSNTGGEHAASGAEYEQIPICALCGVELGIGIPESFKGKQFGDHSFEYYVEKYDVKCPYQTLTKPTLFDRETSKRSFVVNSCGHVYCGRCVIRVCQAKNLTAGEKKSMSKFGGPSNPKNFGPSTCAAEGCRAKLRQAKAFQEVFL